MDALPSYLSLAPTATKLPSNPAGRVVVCASHGGAYAGYLVARTTAAAVILNDAGVGLGEAGIGVLSLCDALGMPAATVAHSSCRIGDAEDMYARGLVSHANPAAEALGCVVSMPCAEAALALRNAPSHGAPAAYAEARTIIGNNAAGLHIACIDSVSLVNDTDHGQIVLSGSHGGVVAGQRALAIRVHAGAAFYNDAGIGMDDAGVSRLPVLDEMGVAAATVDSNLARIGDGRSTYEDGIISRCNTLAQAMGMRIGMPARAAVELVPAGMA
jgi:hypothetical protein